MPILIWQAFLLLNLSVLIKTFVKFNTTKVMRLMRYTVYKL